MNLTELFQLHCRFCWRKFESARLADADAACTEHEKTCPRKPVATCPCGRQA